MSNKYLISETESFKKLTVKEEFEFFYKKLNRYIYPILQRNPFFGKDIVRLQEEFTDIYRFKIADFDLFYTVNEKSVVMLHAAKEKQHEPVSFIKLM